jgi:hypothetical protein
MISILCTYEVQRELRRNGWLLLLEETILVKQFISGRLVMKTTQSTRIKTGKVVTKPDTRITRHGQNQVSKLRVSGRNGYYGINHHWRDPSRTHLVDSI